MHAKIFHHWTFCFPDDGMVLCVPMPGSELGGERRFQIGWFRATDETKLIDLCTDASGRSHGLSIPSPLIRREIIDALKADAKAALAPEIAALLMQASQLILQPIFDCESPRIGFDRVALLGDAAFVARPHVAAGVTKAALDAECLARTLAATHSLHTALAQYDSERRPAGRRLVALGRYLGGHLEGSSGPEQAKPKRDPTKIIREYGGRLTIDETIITSQMSQPA